MGIPRFYRWLSERYPLVNQAVRDHGVPETDGLYLDMNGIIHNATHGNSEEKAKATEKEMILRVFNYIDKLVHIVQPREILFMAIDGVAPRAKMNQQRSRRFKSAREAEAAATQAEREGAPADPDRFDSNCITPGTAFMERLSRHIKYFIRKKMAEDPAWQAPRVVFSGHDIPGEGEHKIMEFLRLQRLRGDYRPNQRHCMYGLDADLIMLALVTHEPHFYLLREVISYAKSDGNRAGQPAREALENPGEDAFMLFHVGLVREYLELEFRGLALPFAFDLERIVDDFVLFCIFVGNDFLPALPTLDIGEGGLNRVFALYKELLPGLGGYLTHAGRLHRGRLEAFLARFGALEGEILKARAEDADKFEAKRARREGGARGRGGFELDPPPPEDFDAQYERMIQGRAALEGRAGEGEGEALEPLEAPEGEGEGEEGPALEGRGRIVTRATMMSKEVRDLWMAAGEENLRDALAMHKHKYYTERLQVPDSPQGRAAVVGAYLIGLHWVLEYYYRGVASWDWFYPFHYAPMASDMQNLSHVAVEFVPGAPFSMFQQLLAVLPPYSSTLLPEPYRFLMCDPRSPIKDFYPTDFDVDMEGKRAEWEGVVLVPFIDQTRLLQAEATHVTPERLSPEERVRNRVGHVLRFEALPPAAPRPPGPQEFCASTLPGDDRWPPVLHCNTRLTKLPPPPALHPDQPGFGPVLVPGTKMGRHAPPGFPTLSTLKFTTEIFTVPVEVFDQSPARRESLNLRMGLPAGLEGVGALQVAALFLNKRCYFGWPFLKEALVSAVADPRGVVEATDPGVLRAYGDDRQREAFRRAAGSSCAELRRKRGMLLDEVQCSVLLHLRPLQGLVRHVDGALERLYDKAAVPVPLQVTLQRHPNPDPRTLGLGLGGAGDAQSNLIEWAASFREGTPCLFLGRTYYGAVATVLGPDPAHAGFLRVAVAPQDGAQQAAQTARRVLTNPAPPLSPAHVVARKCGVSARVLGMVTAAVWVRVGEDDRGRPEKRDLGLNVKQSSKGLYVPDYAQPMPEGQPGWLYSLALQKAVEAYKLRCPWLFQALEARPDGGDLLSLRDLFGPDTPREEALRAVDAAHAYVRAMPLGRRPLVRVTAAVAAGDAIRQLQALLPAPPRAPRTVELEKVSPAFLLAPLDKTTGMLSQLLGDAGAFSLGDRVAFVGGGGPPPFGLRGSVVGVHPEEAFIEVLFDRDFEGGTDLHGRALGSCGALLPCRLVVNLSKPSAVPAPAHLLPKTVTATVNAPRVVAGGSLEAVERALRTEAAVAQDPRAALGDVLRSLQAPAPAPVQMQPPPPLQVQQAPAPVQPQAQAKPQAKPPTPTPVLVERLPAKANKKAAPGKAPPVVAVVQRPAKLKAAPEGARGGGSYASGEAPAPPPPGMPAFLSLGPPPPAIAVPVPIPVPFPVPFPVPTPTPAADAAAGARLLQTLLAPGLSRPAANARAAAPGPAPAAQEEAVSWRMQQGLVLADLGGRGGAAAPSVAPPALNYGATEASARAMRITNASEMFFALAQQGQGK